MREQEGVFRKYKIGGITIPKRKTNCGEEKDVALHFSTPNQTSGVLSRGEVRRKEHY